MIPRPAPEIFRARLAAWGIWAVSCAAPSFLWAIHTGFARPAQLAAMGAGIATYAVAFAWLTSQPVYFERVEPGDFGWALRIAANTRTALAPLMFFGPDVALGTLSVTAVQWCARLVRVDDIAKVNSFGWTYATTMTQGALISVTMFLLALPIWLSRRWWSFSRASRRA